MAIAINPFTAAAASQRPIAASPSLVPMALYSIAA